MSCDTFYCMLGIFIFGFIAGICVVVAGLGYILSYFFNDKPDEGIKKSSIQPTFQLPPVLLSKISDESCKSKETTWALNFVLNFLFHEVRNSEHIRRWMLRKLSMELDELLTSSVLGKFFSSFSIQNIELGNNFPLMNWLKTSSVELHPVFKNISTLNLLLDLEYKGGFEFSIQAESHLKHSAFLSVQLKELKGQARIQFATEPYAHWSFSFEDNPDIDIAVVSQVYGKSFSHITSIISSQLKRSIRKKHTLPMYKIRYKPFFSRMENLNGPLVPNFAPRVESKGNLTVTLMGCRGLMKKYIRGGIHASLAIGDFDFNACYTNEQGEIYVVKDIVCVKTVKRTQDFDFTLIQKNDAITVDSITVSSNKLELKPGDQILYVDRKKVSSVKQCEKNFRNSSSQKVVWKIKRKYNTSTTPDEPKEFNEESILTHRKNSEGEKSLSNSTGTESERSEDAPPSTINLDAQKEKRGSVTFVAEFNEKETTHKVVSTLEIPPSRDPIFNESFQLNVEESSRYFNLCIWSSNKGEFAFSSPKSSPSKRLKAPVFEPQVYGNHIVLGTLSVPLVDIIADCCTTKLGYFVKDFYLHSPDGNASEGREHFLIGHSGFDPNMCYGKISIAFLFKSQIEILEKKEFESTSQKSSNDNNSTQDSQPQCESASIIRNESFSRIYEDSQVHQFTRKHFRTVAMCDFCRKKIWLKEAYICRICQMKCHKKCNEKCLANTICRASGNVETPTPTHSQTSLNPHLNPTPEIITTDISDNTHTVKEFEGECSEDMNNEPEESNSSNAPKTSGRRRTLGAFIVNAVNKSNQLRRVGSATSLIPPNLNFNNSSSRSLPPSPQASPTHSRKTSISNSSSGGLNWNVSNSSPTSNPFQLLESCEGDDDIAATLDNIIQYLNDDSFVSLAKETGKDVYSDLSLTDRKAKLNQILNRLQEQFDFVSQERMNLEKDGQFASTAVAKTSYMNQIGNCEKKVQALALLMLHYCAGLQNVQDLEESATTS